MKSCRKPVPIEFAPAKIQCALTAAVRRAPWILALVVLISSSVAAGELKFPTRWQTDLQMFLESAATVADLRGDGSAQGLIAGREELFVLDGEGKQQWHWRTKGRFMTYPAVLTRQNQP